jgi:hypothetical protein
LAANELKDIIEDVNERRVREETNTVDTETVLPIILETDMVLLYIVEAKTLLEVRLGENILDAIRVLAYIVER